MDLYKFAFAEGLLLLRSLLGVELNDGDGLLGETVSAMEAFVRFADKKADQPMERSPRFHSYAVWTIGLMRALNELEESLFAARYFAERIGEAHWHDLTESELLDYNRHIYFEKNAYIRIFSTLDKTGTLMNELMELRTERVKPYFSYFTVLRRLRDVRRHTDLADQLTELKDRYQPALTRLRERRNMEIHYMNAELKDDLKSSRIAKAEVYEDRKLDAIADNLADLQQGWEMVLGTLYHVFQFAGNRLRQTF